MVRRRPWSSGVRALKPSSRLAAPSSISRTGMLVGGKGGKQALDEVVDIDQVANVFAGAPDLQRTLAFDHPPDQGGRHMADGKVELVVGAVDVGRPHHDGGHRLGNLFGVGT